SMPTSVGQRVLTGKRRGAYRLQVLANACWHSRSWGVNMDTDVLVVGAGPTGLMLAGDLARAGGRCTVLERRADEGNTTRAFAVHARTLEELDARGLADDLIATGTTVKGVRLFDRAQIDLSWLPSRFPYVLVTPQYQTERVLAERATALGVTIVHGARLASLSQT